MDPGDMSGGAAVPEFPEQWKRERVLWFVHEWIQERHAQGDYNPALAVHDVEEWGDGQEA